jgi:hypothetical protein
MILGMSLEAFTRLHVVISVIGIASGLIMLIGLVRRRFLPAWTALFLVSTIATSITGFMLPADGLLPSHLFGVLSLVALTACVIAIFGHRVRGVWRSVFLVTGILALYLNAFVGIVQSFQKIAAIKALAPTQTELPFIIAQGVTFVVFVVLGVLALKRFAR